MFLLMHWPFARIILCSSFGVLAVFYSLRFWKKQHKKWMDTLKLVLVLSWALHGIFVVHHLPGKLILQVVSVLSMMIWIFMEAPTYLAAGNKNLIASSALFCFAAAMVFIGVVMKILHWPFAGIALLLGLLLAVIWFFIFAFPRDGGSKSGQE
jgi:hypothetical protein